MIDFDNVAAIRMGEQPVARVYKGRRMKWEASEPAVTLISIAVTSYPETLAYNQGDALDLTGLAVAAAYSDGSTADVTALCTTSPADRATLDAAGTQRITVSYTENGVTKTTGFDVTVIEVTRLASIAVTSFPAKLVYNQGEALDLTGLAVTATYSDGSAADVTELCTTSPADGATLGASGTQPVVVSYTEDGVTATASFDVGVAAVTALASIAVSALPDAVCYDVGDSFDPSGLRVTATYGDSSTAEVTGRCSVSVDGGASLATAGPRVVTVSYTEQGVTATAQFVVSAANRTSARSWADFVLTSTVTQNIYYTQSDANGVSIDWGDGSAEETKADLAASAAHTYSLMGGYIVSMTAGQGVTWSPGNAVTSGSSTTYYGFCGSGSGKSTTYPTLIAFQFGTGAGLDEQYAFRACTRLKSIVIPNTVTRIPKHCFDSCSGLTSITIPSSVTAFGNGAFSDCDSIAAVYIEDLAQWCSMDISDTYAQLGSNGTNETCSIHSPHSLYLDGTPVTTLTIPSSVTKLCRSAFNHCTSLTSVTIPTTVQQISWHAFFGCSNLTTAILLGACGSYSDIVGSDDAAGARLIEELGGMFQDCTSLVSVTFGTAWDQFRDYMFCGCTSLQTIIIPPLVTNIMTDVFYGCSALTGVSIPANISIIDQGAFLGCSNAFGGNLEVTPATVKASAFRDCGLKKIWIRDSVTTLEVYKTSSGPYNGPFKGNDELDIYADASEAPSGWQTGWNYIGDDASSKATPVFNQVTRPW